MVPPCEHDLLSRRANLWADNDAWDEFCQLRRRASEGGRRVLDVSMLNPDIPPPRLLLDKLVEASLAPAHHRYSVSRGVRKLREAFCSKYRQQFGVELEPDAEVCVTMGTKDALVHGLMVAQIPGRTVLVGKPAYPAHVSASLLAGAQVDYFEIGQTAEATLANIEAKLRHGKTGVLLLNFPNNPTGLTVDKGFYEQLGLVADRYDVLVVNDFVYGEMGYSSPQASILSVPALRGGAVESYSWSKAYSVPGWRVGALLGQAEIVRRLARLKSHIDYGVFLPLQLAAGAALTGPESIPAEITARYRERANVLERLLKGLNWEVDPPSAGASVWARLPEKARHGLRAIQPDCPPALSFARLMLKRGTVVVLPGTIFGAEYADYVRFGLVLPCEQLREVVERIEELMSSLSG